MSLHSRIVVPPLLVLLLGMTPGVRAQDDAGDAPSAPPTISAEVDLVKLLRSKWVFQSPYEDDVWSIAPQPGRRLIHVPLVLRPGEAAYDIGGNVIEVRGGRFIAFHLQADPEVGQSETPPSAVTEALPPDAPLAMRKLTVEAGGMLSKGQLSWKLDRFIPNGTVKDVDLDYAYKLDPRKFEKLDPGRSPVVTREGSEDTRAFQTRKRQIEVDHMTKQRAFRERRDVVSKLPDTFTVPMPDVVWAMYEVPEFSDDLSIGGVDAQRWAKNISTLNALRELVAMNRDEVANLTTTRRLDFVQKLQTLAASKHPLSERLAAYAVNDADLARLAISPSDDVAVLLRTLLTAQDREARLTALTEISSTVPPTRVTLGLIKEFAGQFDPTMQLVSLRGLLSGEIADPQQMQALIASANQMLAEPNGPPPGEVLEAVIESSREQTFDMMATGIDFDAMPDARRGAAIRHVIASAPTQPLAAIWLNRKLLGSQRGPVVRQTVEQLAATKVDLANDERSQTSMPPAPGQAPPSGSGPRSAFGRMLGGVFGGQAEPKSTAEEPAKPAQAATGDDITLTTPIVIDSTEHGFFAALASEDAAVRQAAWRALHCFSLPDQLPEPRDTGFDPASDPYALLIANARAQATMAPTLVPFLQRQGDARRVAWGLVQVVVHGDAAASAQAARALVGARLRLDETIAALPLSDRHRLAQRMYQGMDKTDPLVAGLMRWNNPQNPLIAWFATQVSEGELPSPQRWHEQITGEDQLLLIALSTDRELALAGAAALASSVGGDDEQGREVAKVFDLITTRNAEGARPEWQLQRRRILADRLRAAAGDYDLKLKLFAPPDPAAPPPDANAPLGEPVETVELGAVTLVPEGDGLVMASKTLALSTPPDQFVIRVEKLAELKNFPGERVQQLPLEQVEQTLDLTGDGPRHWQGVFLLPSGAKAQLALEAPK